MRSFGTLWIAAIAALLFGLGAPVMAQDAADPAGDWIGELEVPTGNVPLAVVIARADDGTLSGTLEDSDRMPGLRLPLSSVAYDDGRLTWAVASIGASYAGTWNPAGRRWDGTFSQGGGSLPLILAPGVPSSRPAIAGLDGEWTGVVERNGVKLRQILRVRTVERGTFALYDSPDQLASNLIVTDLAREGQTVRFATSRGLARFEGTLSADGREIAGTWALPGQPPLAFTFTRADPAQAAAAPRARPQEPRPPFPYASEEVKFDNPQFAEVHLAGTLTLPQGTGPFPAAVLITGSGAQDRDETLMGHKPFAVIADHLTRNGIAVLRFDDRGVGGSTGDYAKATSADLATDANAAFAYLQTRPEIRSDAVGFIGHSEGGMIGPIAMAENPQVAFLVMLAGPGTELDKLMLSQRRLIGAQMGLAQDQLDKQEPILAAVFKAIRNADSYEQGLADARAVLTPEAMVALGSAADTAPDLVLQQVGTPWFRYFLRYDPAPNLRKIAVPILALNGSLDRQVPPVENLAAIRAATQGNPDVTIVELPGLNHLFQTARTGGVGEYADIEETVAPAELDAMTAWLTRRFVKP